MIYKAPEALPRVMNASVFLAGSIDMGKAVNWQAQVGKLLNLAGYTVLDPRRDDWDSSWKQSIDNPQFREQVEWELDAMERADTILMHFAPDSQAPITLLELGLHADSGKLIVVCADDYWRKGNVDIVCAGYGIPQYATLLEAVNRIIFDPPARV